MVIHHNTGTDHVPQLDTMPSVNITTASGLMFFSRKNLVTQFGSVPPPPAGLVLCARPLTLSSAYTSCRATRVSQYTKCTLLGLTMSQIPATSDKNTRNVSLSIDPDVSIAITMSPTLCDTPDGIYMPCDKYLRFGLLHVENSLPTINAFRKSLSTARQSTLGATSSCISRNPPEP